MADETPTPDAFQQATMSQLTGVLKLLLTAAGASLVQQGILDQGTMTELSTGIAALIVAFLWMIWARRLTGILKSASAALGDKGVIIGPKAIADRLPANVVPSIEEAATVAPGLLKGAPASEPAAGL